MLKSGLRVTPTVVASIFSFVLLAPRPVHALAIHHVGEAIRSDVVDFGIGR
jgi:hypothetical protein